MKKALGPIPAVFPMPVLMVAAYDENEKVNVMNAAWGMISDMNQITLFLSEDHKTTANILTTKAFTVALADKDHMDVADFFGIATGNTMKAGDRERYILCDSWKDHQHERRGIGAG